MNVVKRVITVAIIDTNQFYSDGLRQVVREHFGKQGRQVHFVSGVWVGHADIIFQQVVVGRGSGFCTRVKSDWARNPLFFTIREPYSRGRHLQRQKHDKCALNSGEIYRNEPLNSVMQRVDDALMLAGERPQGAHQHYCDCCRRNMLTLREKQVLRFLSVVGSSTAVADLLRLSVKSVSMYKRSAMSKLGLQHNLELYHWFRLGGLNGRKV